MKNSWCDNSCYKKKVKMADNLGPIHCLYSAKAVPMNGAPFLRMLTKQHSEGCRKMSCLNGSRKLHFVQKIRLDRIIYLWPNGFSARSAIFCRYWTCSFSGSQARLLMPVPLPFLPNLNIYFHPTFNVVATLKISQNII